MEFRKDIAMKAVKRITALLLAALLVLAAAACSDNPAGEDGKQPPAARGSSWMTASVSGLRMTMR
ncbi:MAG: hypothetical protein IKZ41_04830, partial [Clostridia bacterium]|nr:hypothetical protein [Clostridia bacterium]